MCVTRVDIAGKKDWLLAARRDVLWLAFNLLYLKKQQQEQKKSSSNNDNVNYGKNTGREMRPWKLDQRKRLLESSHFLL